MWTCNIQNIQENGLKLLDGEEAIQRKNIWENNDNSRASFLKTSSIPWSSVHSFLNQCYFLNLSFSFLHISQILKKYNWYLGKRPLWGGQMVTAWCLSLKMHWSNNWPLRKLGMMWITKCCLKLGDSLFYL